MTPQPYGRSAYPLAGEPPINLSLIDENLGKHAEKFWFEGECKQGMSGIRDLETGEALTYLYDINDVPYLAVWANYGVFNQDYTAALEPATGYLDDLYTAHLMKKVKTVTPYETNQWYFTIAIDNYKE